MFSRVDLPAPEGPIMAVNSPDRMHPLTDFKIVFSPGKMKKIGQHEYKVKIKNVKILNVRKSLLETDFGFFDWQNSCDSITNVF